jgi:hypothetical protein
MSRRGPVTVVSLRTTRPPVGAESPAMMCRSVDLPHPDGPITDTKLPCCTVNETFSMAARPWAAKCFSTSSTTR